MWVQIMGSKALWLSGTNRNIWNDLFELNTFKFINHRSSHLQTLPWIFISFHFEINVKRLNNLCQFYCPLIKKMYKKEWKLILFLFMRKIGLGKCIMLYINELYISFMWERPFMYFVLLFVTLCVLKFLWKDNKVKF